MPARGQFSLNRRTKTSNFSDVGHTLISSGISTKIRTTPVTLQPRISHTGQGVRLQADDGEDDEERSMKDIGDSKRNADYGGISRDDNCVCTEDGEDA